MPKEPHVPKNAKGTTVRLAREEYEAWHQIAIAREASSDEGIGTRVRLNDVLVDGLWELLRRQVKPESIRETLPESLRTQEPIIPAPSKITQMAKKKR